jgi:hypothetical protein
MAARTRSGIRLIHYLGGPALAVGLAIGLAATAAAEDVWDIEAYDNCMSKTVRSAEVCCIASGGTVTSGERDDGCVAPPATEAENVPGNPAPTLPGGQPRPPTAPADSVG